MATTFTTRLGLRKPDPNPTTGDFVDVAQDLNANYDKVDAAIDTVCTSSTRPTTGLFVGKQIFETDTLRFLVCGSLGPTVWRNATTSLINVVTAFTEITSPFFNQIVHFQPDGCLYRYNGSSWIKYTPPADPVGGEYRASGTQNMAVGGNKVNFGTTITAAAGIAWNGSNQFTTQSSGLYCISAQIYMPGGAGLQNACYLGTSAATLFGPPGALFMDGLMTPSGFTCSASVTVSLGSGTTISAYVYNNNGGVQVSAFGTMPAEFRVWKVGP